MDTGSIAKPATTSAPSAPQRAETLVGAVKTELAPEAAVRQVSQTEPVRFDLTNGAATRAALDQAIRETIDRRLIVDPKNREVVYQAVDETTGEIVRQVPDEAILRLRAYARLMREKSESDVRRVEKIV
jgi:flagellar protein FlaG